MFIDINARFNVVEYRVALTAQQYKKTQNTLTIG